MDGGYTRRGLFIAVCLLLCGFAVSQPIPKSNWRAINDKAISIRGGFPGFPRVASFSNGDYAVVYAIGTNVSNRMITKIFNSDGSVKVPEKELNTLTTPFNYAPNIIVMEDVAIASWRTLYDSRILPSNAQFYSNGIRTWYLTTGWANPLNTEDILGLFPVTGSSIFGLTLSPPIASATSAIVWYRTFATNQLVASYGNVTEVIDTPTAIYDQPSNTSIYFFPISGATTVSKFNGYRAEGGAETVKVSTLPESIHIVPFKCDLSNVLPFVLVDAQTSAVTLYMLDQTTLMVITQRTLFSGSTTRAKRPDVVYLGSNYALVAHSTVNSSSVSYRYVKLQQTSIDFIGPVIVDPTPTEGVSMARVGKDIVVTALSGDQTQVMTRVLTFCGNGVVDFDEECEGSKGCTTECKCQAGTVINNGVCISQCGNGVVTGNEDCDSSEGCDPITCKCQAGYQPLVIQKTCTRAEVTFVPSVGPSLDCLTFVDQGNSINLFFSFTSNDPFDQTIEYGPLNNVIPSDLATNRPTFFASGTSPTYPVSPYNVTIPRSVTQFTWLLGSYNLTVDLSGNKADALQCPTDAVIVLTVTSFAELNNTDIQQLLMNIATKYNISVTRLDATYTLISASTETEPNVYSVIVTITSSSNTSDPTPQDVAKDLYSDLLNSKEQTVSNLTLGLGEKNPQIKDMTPAPTGVEVRGQQRDIPPSTFVVPSAASSSHITFSNAALVATVLTALIALL